MPLAWDRIPRGGHPRRAISPKLILPQGISLPLLDKQNYQPKGNVRLTLIHSLFCIRCVRYANMADFEVNSSIWHPRLGHLSAPNPSIIESKSLVGVDISGLEDCEGCSTGKQIAPLVL